MNRFDVFDDDEIKDPLNLPTFDLNGLDDEFIPTIFDSEGLYEPELEEMILESINISTKNLFNAHSLEKNEIVTNLVNQQMFILQQENVLFHDVKEELKEIFTKQWKEYQWKEFKKEPVKNVKYVYVREDDLYKPVNYKKSYLEIMKKDKNYYENFETFTATFDKDPNKWDWKIICNNMLLEGECVAFQRRNFETSLTTDKDWVQTTMLTRIHDLYVPLANKQKNMGHKTILFFSILSKAKTIWMKVMGALQWAYFFYQYKHYFYQALGLLFVGDEVVVKGESVLNFFYNGYLGFWSTDAEVQSKSFFKAAATWGSVEPLLQYANSFGHDIGLAGATVVIGLAPIGVPATALLTATAITAKFYSQYTSSKVIKVGPEVLLFTGLYVKYTGHVVKAEKVQIIYNNGNAMLHKTIIGPLTGMAYSAFAKIMALVTSVRTPNAEKIIEVVKETQEVKEQEQGYVDQLLNYIDGIGKGAEVNEKVVNKMIKMLREDWEEYDSPTVDTETIGKLKRDLKGDFLQDLLPTDEADVEIITDDLHDLTNEEIEKIQEITGQQTAKNEQWKGVPMNEFNDYGRVNENYSINQGPQGNLEIQEIGPSLQPNSTQSFSGMYAGIPIVGLLLAGSIYLKKKNMENSELFNIN
jgi:hypothetical protein